MNDTPAVTWCRSLSAWQALEPEWNDLLARSAASSVFLTWEWLSVWWRHFGEGSELFVPVLRSPDGVLRGVAPLKRTPRRGRLGWSRAVEFLGYGGAVNPDHLDVVLERGWEKAGLQAFVEAFRARRDEWDILNLSGVPEDSPVARALPDIAAGARLRLARHRHVVCPYLDLPGSHEELLAGVGAKLRRDIRRASKELAPRHALEIVALDTPDLVEEGLRDLAALHQRRMEDSGRRGNFGQDAYTAFHRDLAHTFARLGWLELKVLRIDGRSAAAAYGFTHARVYSDYQKGLDPTYYRYSLGSLLFSELLRGLIEKRVRRVDMLRGRGEWKYRWTDRERVDLAILVSERGLRGSRAHLSHVLAGSAAIVLKRLLPPDRFDALQDRVKHLRDRRAAKQAAART